MFKYKQFTCLSKRNTSKMAQLASKKIEIIVKYVWWWDSQLWQKIGKSKVRDGRRRGERERERKMCHRESFLKIKGSYTNKQAFYITIDIVSNYLGIWVV